MANTFKVKTNGALPASAGTHDTVYTCPASTSTIVIGLTLCNIHTVAVTASVQLVSDTSDTETNETVQLVKDVSIPAASALDVLNGSRVNLVATDTVTLVSSAPVSADAILSIMERT